MYQELIDNARHPSRPVGEYSPGIDQIFGMTVHESLKVLGFVVPAHVTGYYDDEVKQAIGEFRFGTGGANDAMMDEQFWDALANAVEDYALQQPPEAAAQPAAHHEQHGAGGLFGDQQCHEELHAPSPVSAHLDGDLAHAEGWLQAYQRYRAGVGTFSDEDLQFLHWADRSPEWQEAYAEWEAVQHDNELVMWEDGSQSTRREHREGERRRAIQRALDVLTGNSVGSITFGVAKMGGASDEDAASYGEFAGNAAGMYGTHQNAVRQGTPAPASTSGPNYGEHPR